MTRPVVVGLGPVPADVVGPVLGDVDFVAQPEPEDLARAEGAIVRAAVKVGQTQLDAMPALRVIARTGVGVDDVDMAAAAARNLPVAITPGANTNAVAEGTMAHILHLVKSLGPLTDLIRQGGWAQRTEIPVGDLEDSTLGIVGYGRIGQRVSHLGEAFGMKILAFDPVAQVPAEIDAGSMESLIESSDIISLHLPLLSSTRNIIDATAQERTRPGAVLVNVARGGLVDLDAALAALESGHLGGLGLDSFDPEPAQPHPVYRHPRVVLTPHVMGLSAKASRATFIDAARAVRAVLDGGAPAAAAD
jgi:phosphoglycerate dehydrogenase-like enzyme